MILTSTSTSPQDCFQCVLHPACVCAGDYIDQHAELHEVFTSLPQKPVKVILDGIPSLQGVDCTTQLGIISKLAKSALDPTVHDTDKC